MSPPDSSSGADPALEATTIAVNGSKHKKAVDSLGEALAGVTIGGAGGVGGENHHTSSSGHHSQFGSSSIAASGPFALAPGSNSTTSASNNATTNNGAAAASQAADKNDGWGNSPATQALEKAAKHASENGAGGNAAATTPHGSNNHVRNESLELFLSQSPSQTLGEDVFKFSHNNLPALAEEDRHASAEADAFNTTGTGGSSSATSLPTQFGEIRAPPSQERRRTESPASCSVTGTTTSSRSVSPYNSSSNNPRFGGGGDASSDTASMPRQHGSNPSLVTLEEHAPSNSHHSSSKSAVAPTPSMNNGSSINNSGSGTKLHVLQHQPGSFENGGGYTNAAPSYAPQQLPGLEHHQPLIPHMAHQQVPNVSAAAPTTTVAPTAGQVLYMAVPSPDGRGQVLQPVQMMQLPGKPYTYVVPGTAGAAGAVASDPQAMVVLPPVMGGGAGMIDQHPSPYGGDTRPAMNRSGSSNLDTSASSSLYGASSNNNDAAALLNNNDEYSLKSPASQQPYQTDPVIASLYAAPQRPPLDALLGQIRRLSRDQVGCRLVQQALDEEGPMAASLILQEGMPFWGEAMVDPFGNYLFQKILEKITPDERISLVQNVSTRLVNASLNLHGTRSVQKVVELCAQDELDGHLGGEGGESAAALLTKALSPAAARLCIDSHGNHVIQRILLRLAPQHSQFIFDAVAASVGDVARHRHGCCVIQRCLDSPNTPARAHLVLRIVDKSLELMQDAYGNYVVQYVLDVCSDEDVHAVCESVVGQVNLLAIQKFSSNVMEKCLERCSDSVKEMYLSEMSDSDRIRELMMDPFGNYVVQRALSVATHSQAIRLVEAMRPHLMATGPPGLGRNGGVRNTAGGRRIIAKICRRFPNFTLNPPVAGGGQEELYSPNNKGNHHHHHHHHRYLNHHQQGHPQQQQGHHLQPHQLQQHKQQQHAPMVAAYAPVGAPLHLQPQQMLYGQPQSDSPQQQLYAPMPQQQPSQQQQQQHYGALGGNLSLNGAAAYYSPDPFAEHRGMGGGYPGAGGGGM